MNEKIYRLALAGLQHNWELLGLTQAAVAPSEMKRVTLAAQLAAGNAERAETPVSSPQQVQSIFTSIAINGHTLPDKERAWLPLAPLALEEDVLFPGQRWPQAQLESAWREMKNDLAQECAAVTKAYANDGDPAIYLESCLLLLQRYASRLPSTQAELPTDVSLYDHSRMTAALAAVLEALDDTKITSLLEQPERDDEVALLVGGDLSGTQDFLYTITSRGATSALRGRSFYLQLLTEAITRYVLHKLDLPITNLIYQGGGNFYILARASDAARLPAIQREISRILLQHHRGALYVALAGQPLAARDFFAGRLSAKWGALAEAQQSSKLQRFFELEKADLNWLFQPLGDGGNEDKQCQVCGREHPGTKKIGDVRKCPQCRSYEALGDDLRKARYLVLEMLPDVKAVSFDAPPGKAEEALAAFGLKARPLPNLQSAPTTQNPVVMLAIKDDAMAKPRPGPRMAIGRRFLVNVTPILSEKLYKEYKDEIEESYWRNKEGVWPDPVKPFSVLTAQSTGIKRLAALRMDVDNLGKIFAEGLAENATLSRVAGLSLAISLYFEGWVEKLAETRQKISAKGEGDRLYSIYSGGDDLFFVGSWDAVVDFARQVRGDLDRYTAHHPAIHVSGGIVLVGSKYPLAQAAQDAGDAEHAAKGYQRWDKTQQRMVIAKDAISFLGQVQPWARFGLEARSGMDSVVGLTMLLSDMVDRGAPRSLIRNLSRLYTQYDAALQARARHGDDTVGQGQPQTLWGPWMWRGYYLLKRAKQADIRTLAQTLHEDDFRSMAWMGLAARWADLLQRQRRYSSKRSNENEHLTDSSN